MAESFNAQQTTSMHSRKLQCTAKSFNAQHEALLHNRKFCYIAKKSVLWQKLEKSSFCGRNQRKVPSTAETEDKHHVLPTVSVLLVDEAQFAHKSDQIELQLDRSQLHYSEYLGLILQEVAQPDTTKKAHYIKLATPLGSQDQDGENEIFLPRKHVSKSSPKQDMQMFLNLPGYTPRKVS